MASVEQGQFAGWRGHGGTNTRVSDETVVEVRKGQGVQGRGQRRAGAQGGGQTTESVEALDQEVEVLDAGHGLGDSMYDGAIYVGGKVASLGVDCVDENGSYNLVDEGNVYEMAGNDVPTVALHFEHQARHMEWEVYRANVMSKTSATNLSDLVRIAILAKF